MTNIENMIIININKITNIIIDITPPSYFLGSEFKPDVSGYFSIPFTCEAGELSVDVFINE